MVGTRQSFDHAIQPLDDALHRMGHVADRVRQPIVGGFESADVARCNLALFGEFINQGVDTCVGVIGTDLGTLGSILGGRHLGRNAIPKCKHAAHSTEQCNRGANRVKQYRPIHFMRPILL